MAFDEITAFGRPSPELANITAQNAGASEMAVRAALRIMNCDGLAIVRGNCSPDYDANAFAATWARWIDAEFARIVADAVALGTAIAAELPADVALRVVQRANKIAEARTQKVDELVKY